MLLSFRFNACFGVLWIAIILLTSTALKNEDIKVCFYSNTAGERGTEIAMYEYADYLEKLYNMKAHIIFPKLMVTSNKLSDQMIKKNELLGIGGQGTRLSLPKFNARFNVSYCGEEYSDETYHRIMDEFARNPAPYPICNQLSWEAKHSFGCDVLYIIKGGMKRHSPMAPSAFGELPTMVHAVFDWDVHGSVYAAISPSIRSYHRSGNVVPHMVIPPDPDVVAKAESYRAKFGIPEDVLTICRHGGEDSFNIVSAQFAFLDLLSVFNETKLHFVFMGTDTFKQQFLDLAKDTDNYSFFANAVEKQLHFLPSTTDAVAKESYFKTCDVMLHARLNGETFGLAVAEFSVRNKPVITHSSRGHRHYADFHVRTLGNKALLFNSQGEMVQIVTKLVQEGIPKGVDFNCYRDFEPVKVMHIFKTLLLDPAISLIGQNLTGVASMW